MQLSSNKIHPLEKIIFSGIILLLVFSPFAFGSVHVWAYTAVETGVFSLLLLFVARKLFFSDSSAFDWVRTPVNPAILALLLLIVLQMVPLPPSLAELVSPLTFSDKLKIFGTAAPESAGSWTSLAYYRHPAIIESLKLIACFGMFFLVLNTAVTKKRINTLICVMIGMGVFEALYAIFQAFSETPRVLWWASRIGRHNWASGTFIGANHFGFYMEMIFFLGLGYLIACKQDEKSYRSRRRKPLRKRILNWASDSDNLKQIFLLAISMVVGVGLLFSASRGGILSAGVSVTIVSAMLFARKRFRRYGFFALLFFVGTLFYGLSAGMQPTLDKFEKRKEGLELRLKITESVLPMISDYPVAGVGWGNFRYLYPRYIRDADDVSGSGYSHNDWVEAWIELGTAGGMLVVAAFSACFLSIFAVWRKRRSRYAIGIGMGVMGALLSVGIHSFFDFSMHIPANPLTLAALAGIGYAAVNMKCRGKFVCFFYDVRKIGLTRARRVVSGFLAVVLFVGAGTLAMRHFLAELNCPTEWNSTLNLNWNPFLTEIHKAVNWNPSNAAYHDRLAQYYTKGASSGDAFLRKEFNEKAITSLKKAASLNPACGKYWFDLGTCYSRKNYDPEYIGKWLPLADACLDFAAECAPKDANMLFAIASYRVRRSKLFEDDASRKKAIAGFQELFRRSLALNPGNLEKAEEIVRKHYPDLSILRGIAPSGDLSILTEACTNSGFRSRKNS